MGDAQLPEHLERAAAGVHEDRAWCVGALRRYFHGDRDRSPRSGAFFDRFQGRGDAAPYTDTVTVSDLLAVNLLDVRVPGDAVLRILGEAAPEIESLLGEVDSDVDLHTADEALIAPGSSAEQLWDLLRAYRRPSVPGTGPTVTSKILARKRPRLIPIYDSVVAQQLGLRDHRDYWREYHCLLRNEKLVALLEWASAEVELCDVSLLRAFDVLLWMSAPLRKDGNAEGDAAA
jgi:hypothetical protein